MIDIGSIACILALYPTQTYSALLSITVKTFFISIVLEPSEAHKLQRKLRCFFTPHYSAQKFTTTKTFTLSNIYDEAFCGTPWTQDENWTYIRRSEGIQCVFWTSYVRSIYVLYPGGNSQRLRIHEELHYIPRGSH